MAAGPGPVRRHPFQPAFGGDDLDELAAAKLLRLWRRADVLTVDEFAEVVRRFAQPRVPT